MKHLKKNKRQMVHTVKGKAAAVVQNAEAYQRDLAHLNGERVRIDRLARKLCGRFGYAAS